VDGGFFCGRRKALGAREFFDVVSGSIIIEGGMCRKPVTEPKRALIIEF
jgi:hypothetical protein